MGHLCTISFILAPGLLPLGLILTARILPAFMSLTTNDISFFPASGSPRPLSTPCWICFPFRLSVVTCQTSYFVSTTFLSSP